MKKATFIYPVIFMLLSSCTPAWPKGQSAGRAFSLVSLLYNPLDAILGEKVLDATTLEMRPDNFELFYELSAADLLKKSKLYTVNRLDENSYLLKQNKRYESARYFNVLLETDKDSVVDYFVLNDFTIADTRKMEDGLIVLCSDFENYNRYWVSSASVTILKLDHEFDTMWSYHADPCDPALDAVGIVEEGGRLFYSIDVMTGSHMLPNLVYLELDENGAFKSVKEVSHAETGPLEREVLESIFDPEASDQ